MKLWTHHSSSFRIDSLVLPIDPTKGQYYKQQLGGGVRFPLLCPGHQVG